MPVYSSDNKLVVSISIFEHRSNYIISNSRIMPALQSKISKNISIKFYIIDCITKKVYFVNIMDNVFYDLNKLDLESLGNPFVFSE